MQSLLEYDGSGRGDGRKERSFFKKNLVFYGSWGNERQKYLSHWYTRNDTVMCRWHLFPVWDCKFFTEPEYHQLALDVMILIITSGLY